MFWSKFWVLPRAKNVNRQNVLFNKTKKKLSFNYIYFFEPQQSYQLSNVGLITLIFSSA